MKFEICIYKTAPDIQSKIMVDKGKNYVWYEATSVSIIFYWSDHFLLSMKCTHSENLSNYYLQLDLVIEGNSGLTFTSLLLFVVILLIYTG